MTANCLIHFSFSGLILATDGHAVAAAEEPAAENGIGIDARAAAVRGRKRRSVSEGEIETRTETRTEKRTGVKTKQTKRGKCGIGFWHVRIHVQVDTNTPNKVVLAQVKLQGLDGD